MVVYVPRDVILKFGFFDDSIPDTGEDYIWGPDEPLCVLVRWSEPGPARPEDRYDGEHRNAKHGHSSF